MFVAAATGKPDAHINPAVTIAAAIASGCSRTSVMGPPASSRP
nr:hypothetical protein [Methylobacterium sp. Leaf94]